MEETSGYIRSSLVPSQRIDVGDASSHPEFDARQSIDHALLHLSKRLRPIIESTLNPCLDGVAWTTVLTEMDRTRGRASRRHDPNDLQTQLRALTERFGHLGHPFDDHTRLVSALGNELRVVRNSWAHQKEFTPLDAWRAHDFVIRLLEHLGDSVGAGAAFDMRQQALRVLSEEARANVEWIIHEPIPTPRTDSPGETAGDIVEPPAEMWQRTDSLHTPTIGAGRFEFEPWIVVPVGDTSVLDELMKRSSREKVRSLATEIVEFEGPIHMDRLLRLISRSFGMQRLRSARGEKLSRQIRRTGLLVDHDRFVWPTDIDPESWLEFRPNNSSADRAFTEISPVEIANAMRTLRTANPSIPQRELEVSTLQAFGRRRRTAAVTSHLNKASVRL